VSAYDFGIFSKLFYPDAGQNMDEVSTQTSGLLASHDFLISLILSINVLYAIISDLKGMPCFKNS
jgi:hypothetical protein